MTFFHLFYKFATPVLIIQIENQQNSQKEFYILQKSKFIENNITDAIVFSKAPKTKITSPEELEKILHPYLHLKVPILNENIEFIQYYNVPLSIEKNYSNGEVQNVSSNLSEKKQTSQNKEIIFSKQFSKKIKQIIIHNKLITASIEAIILPLCSISLKGNPIFINQKWQKHQIQYPELLEYQTIFENAQNLVAQQIISFGQIKSHFVLNISIPMFQLFCAPIKKSQVNKSHKLLGYLCWLEKKVPQYKAENKEHINYINFFSNQENNLKNYLESEEKKILLWAITEANDDIKKAASLLKITKKSFSNKINKYNISLDYACL